MSENYDCFTADEEKGLRYKEQLLTTFIPKIVECRCVRNVSDDNAQREYLVEVTYTDGREKCSRWIEEIELRNIDWFRRFVINDCFMDRNTRKLLAFKLMQEAESVQCKDLTKLGYDLYKINDRFKYVFGKNVEPNGDDVIVDKACQELNLAKYKDVKEMLRLCFLYISLIPGITEILFYGLLFAIVKPFLAQLNITGAFTLCLVAPAGHLKTTLARKYALWLRQTDEQEIGFYDRRRDKYILDVIESLKGQNFLLDDIHEISNVNERNRQEQRLDVVARHVHRNIACANVIVTGETMDKMGKFSCRDRIFQIRMPQMDAKQIEDLKVKISSLESRLMPSVALAFVKSLMKNPENVLQDIQNFCDENGIDKEAGDGCGTRIYRYAAFIRMTKYLFDKYLYYPELGIIGDEDSFDSALKHQIDLQQVELQKLRLRDEKHDYIAELYDIIRNGIHIKVCGFNDYKDYDNCCRLDGDRIYITTNALKNAFFGYYQRYVQVNLIIEAFHEEGILEEEPGSKGRQKNFNGKKHYVLNRRIWSNYLHRNNHTLVDSDSQYISDTD